MTRTSKIAVSLPSAQVQSVRRAVARGEAASVSAYVSQAIAKADRERELADLVADLVAAGGEPTAADYTWAREVLGASR
ncbi:MAG: toxin-antitoxin system antitoxin subunit [Acidimicrobiales bacterium]